MPRAKKYDYRVSADNGLWKAEITRRASSRKTIISKSETGFSSEAEATEWAETTLKSFLQNLNERNKRHAEKR